MNSFHAKFLDNLKIRHDVIANIREIGEGKGKQELFAERAPQILENLKKVAIIESTESSNRLEGITLPRTVLEKIMRDVYKVLAYARVANTEAMSNLHEAYIEASESDVDALILVALYILDFLCFHHFSDGNGRMVRLLTVLLLYREEYDVGRYISIARIIEGTKESYYDSLLQSSQGWHAAKHDPMPWVSYFLCVIRAAYGELSERVGEFKGARGVKTQLVLQAIEQ